MLSHLSQAFFQNKCNVSLHGVSIAMGAFFIQMVSHFKLTQRIGNQSVIATAKLQVPKAKLTIVVGSVRGGRSTFVKYLEHLLVKSFRFEYYDCDAGAEALRKMIQDAAIQVESPSDVNKINK